MRKYFAPIILAILFMNCEENDLPNTETINVFETVSEYTITNQIFQDVGNNSGDAVLSGENSITGKSNNTKTDGPIISVVPLDFTTFPKTIISIINQVYYAEMVLHEKVL